VLNSAESSSIDVFPYYFMDINPILCINVMNNHISLTFTIICAKKWENLKNAENAEKC